MQRLMRDFKRLQNDPPQGVNGSPKNDSIMLWNAVIFGPDDTPWDGGSSQWLLIAEALLIVQDFGKNNCLHCGCRHFQADPRIF